MLPLFAACTADYSPAAPADDLLPPDTYPLQIASLTIAADGQPGTRLADNGNATSWQPNDRVMVSLGDRQAIYTYTADTDTWQSDAPLYWQSKAPQTVNAWYPVANEIDFTQQDVQGLTYLLKADPVSATYGQEEPVNLTFTHQLAKVRVVLEGAKAQDVAAVTVRSYPKGINDKGALGARTDDAPLYVPMLQTTYEGQPCWEATLRPGTLQAGDSFKVAAEGGTPMQVVLDENISIEAGEVYTITINVEQAPKEIDLDTYEGPTLAVSGKTILKGDGQQKNLQVTVEADAEVTLENVVLQPSAIGNAITCNGNATITLVGNNDLTAKSNGNVETYGSGIYVKSGTLTINGNGSLNISREYAASDFWSVGAGIGAGNGANILIESGDISISDVPAAGSSSGAGIGSTTQENCGNITIKGGTIRIGKPSWRSACIGSASYKSCGDITISGESTVITFTQGDYAPWGIGNGDSGTCGTVTITGGATVNGVKYTETHTGPL